MDYQSSPRQGTIVVPSLCDSTRYATSRPDEDAPIPHPSGYLLRPFALGLAPTVVAADIGICGHRDWPCSALPCLA
jgi:hypothetical protein